MFNICIIGGDYCYKVYVSTVNFYDKMKHNVTFDSRVYIIPEKDVENYFIYRQMDWERNSLHMLTRKYYSQKKMDNKSCADYHDMLHDKGINWNDLSTYLKRGRCIVKKEEKVMVNNDHFQGEVIRNNWIVDLDIPIFKDNRNYIIDRLGDDKENVDTQT